VLKVDALCAVDDRVRQVCLERLFASRLARAEHVERHARDNRRQPAAEIVDLAFVRAAQADPRFLEGVVGLAGGAQHPVG